MDHWMGRVALVTGASSGIGRAIAARLAQHGMKVVACGRTFEQLKELAETHQADVGIIVPIQCDLRKEEEILAMFQRIRSELGGVDVCVNNAGVNYNAPLLSGSTDKWREILEVNVLALNICSREAIKSMRERGVDDGFIVNIGSIAGHFQELISITPFYSSAKHSVRSLSNALSAELRECNSRIRVMEISPGPVETNLFARVRGKPAADDFFSAFEVLSVDDMADSVIHGMTAAQRAQVSEVILTDINVDRTRFMKWAKSMSEKAALIPLPNVQSDYNTKL